MYNWCRSEIVKTVNDALDLDLTATGNLGNNVVICRDDDGKKYLIIGSGDEMLVENPTDPQRFEFSIFSLLKQRGKTEMQWNPNGEPSKGSILVHKFDPIKLDLVYKIKAVA